jgi:hypothetical protein
LNQLDIQIDQIQNPLQRGFTEAIPMLFAVFIASEVITFLLLGRCIEEFEYVVCLQIVVFLADSEIIWYQRMTLS